jgi:uncharacterized low-complexity protein
MMATGEQGEAEGPLRKKLRGALDILFGKQMAKAHDDSTPTKRKAEDDSSPRTEPKRVAVAASPEEQGEAKGEGKGGAQKAAADVARTGEGKGEAQKAAADVARTGDGARVSAGAPSIMRTLDAPKIDIAFSGQQLILISKETENKKLLKNSVLLEIKEGKMEKCASCQKEHKGLAYNLTPSSRVYNKSSGAIQTIKQMVKDASATCVQGFTPFATGSPPAVLVPTGTREFVAAGDLALAAIKVAEKATSLEVLFIVGPLKATPKLLDVFGVVVMNKNQVLLKASASVALE